MDHILNVVGEHIAPQVLVRDAVRLLRVSRSALASLGIFRDLSWVGQPNFQLGDPQISVAELIGMFVDLPAHAQSWVIRSHLGERTRLNSQLCCWPLVRLALKHQHVAILRGAPQLTAAADGMICIWLRSRVLRELPEKNSWRRGPPSGELSSFVHALGIVPGPGLLLVRHRLLTLDHCRGSPDSPSGLEHCPQAVLAPNWHEMTRFLGRMAPKWLAELENELGLTPSPTSDDSNVALHSDFDSISGTAAWIGAGHDGAWVEMIDPKSVFAAADSFIARADTQPASTSST